MEKYKGKCGSNTSLTVIFKGGVTIAPFTDEETESGRGSAFCSRSHNWEELELGFEALSEPLLVTTVFLGGERVARTAGRADTELI